MFSLRSLRHPRDLKQTTIPKGDLVMHTLSSFIFSQVRRGFVGDICRGYVFEGIGVRDFARATDFRGGNRG